MTTFHLMILISSIVEIILLFLVFIFFWKLRKSEILLSSLEKKQQAFVERLDFNSRLEQELMTNFGQRQKELIDLEEKLAQRSRELQKLLRQAEAFSSSPQFLRQTILSGYRRGQSIQALARATGLSQDEVELIIDQE